MASFTTTVMGQILHLNKTPATGVTVQLYGLIEAQVGPKGYRNVSPYSSALTTDSDGRVEFSGVAAGIYDIYVSGSSYQMQNYQVNNSYVVVPGGSEFTEESRTFVRSNETLAPSGIAQGNPYRPNNQLGYPDDTLPESMYLLGTVSGSYVNRLDDSAFSTVTYKEREFDNVYYRGNQNVTLVQNFIFRLPR